MAAGSTCCCTHFSDREPWREKMVLACVSVPWTTSDVSELVVPVYQSQLPAW